MVRLGKILSVMICSLFIVYPSQIVTANEKNSLPITTQFLSGSVLSNGYVHARAITDTLNKLAGYNISVKPVADSAHRTELLLSRPTEFCICDMESYFAQEGLLEFAASDKGPTDLRLMISAFSDFKMGLAIAKDSRAKSITDLRGKRIPWIRDAQQLNANMTAFLHFAGLDWADVQKFTYPDYKAAMVGFARDQLDAILISPSQPQFAQLQKGKRGFFLADFDTSKKIAWRRMKTIAPYLQPSSSDGWNGVTHPYPLLLTTATQDMEIVYQLTKSISENLENISSILPTAEGWHTSWQNLTWVMPFHEGAIKYFQEIGIWSDQAQSHQDDLIRRQAVLQNSFKDFKAQNPDPETFSIEWQKFRNIQLETLTAQ